MISITKVPFRLFVLLIALAFGVTAGAIPSGKRKDKEKDKNNTSGQPEQKQERNYSQEGNQPVFASLPDESPVASATTYRRFV